MSQRQDQKDKTRKALLNGARAILTRGEALTIAGAARETGISKASAYRYYSDPALLAAEAGLHLKIASYEEMVAGADTLRDRLVAISLSFFDLAVGNEAAFRTYLSLNLQASVSSDATRRRGARRIKAYHRALAESQTPIPAAQAAKIAAALGMATGPEAMIALFDIAGLSKSEARVIISETAHAICDRMLAQG